MLQSALQTVSQSAWKGVLKSMLKSVFHSAHRGVLHLPARRTVARSRLADADGWTMTKREHDRYPLAMRTHSLQGLHAVAIVYTSLLFPASPEPSAFRRKVSGKFSWRASRRKGRKLNVRESVRRWRFRPNVRGRALASALPANA